MDAILFGLKRGYWASTRCTRPALAAFGLTPARYDLMHIIVSRGGCFFQSGLHVALGVARSTVSRMVIALERAGLVHRRLDADDKRQRVVELSREGGRRFGRAQATLVSSRRVQGIVDDAITARRWLPPRPEIVPRLRISLTSHLNRFRLAFGERIADLYDPDEHPPPPLWDVPYGASSSATPAMCSL